MDHTRLDTMGVLAADILGRPAPETDIPKDREYAEAEDDNYNFIGADAIEAAIEAGKLVQSSNYFGIPYAWKQGEGVYRCTLLQYRNITENPTFATAHEAAQWFEEKHYATEG